MNAHVLPAYVRDTVWIYPVADPDRPGRTGYGLKGPSFEAVQRIISDLQFEDGVTKATFTLPARSHLDGLWFATGSVHRASTTPTERT